MNRDTQLFIHAFSLLDRYVLKQQVEGITHTRGYTLDNMISREIRRHTIVFKLPDDHYISRRNAESM